MRERVILCGCLLAVCCFSTAYGVGRESKDDYTALGLSVGMLAPMGDFAQGYNPSLVFGLALLTRPFELEVQYSSLGDEFAEEARSYGYDIPNADMWILAAGVRVPVASEFSLCCGAELNWAGADYQAEIGPFHITSTKSMEYGVTAGAELAPALARKSELLMRFKVHWLPRAEVYFLTFGMGVSFSSGR